MSNQACAAKVDIPAVVVDHANLCCGRVAGFAFCVLRAPRAPQVERAHSRLERHFSLPKGAGPPTCISGSVTRKLGLEKSSAAAVASMRVCVCDLMHPCSAHQAISSPSHSLRRFCPALVRRRELAAGEVDREMRVEMHARRHWRSTGFIEVAAALEHDIDPPQAQHL